MSVTYGSFAYLMLYGETRLLRFFFGVSTVLFSAFMLIGAPSQWEYSLTIRLLSPDIWAAFFIISGVSLIYGAVTCRYSKLSLVFESILSTASWTAVGITSMISQGTIGAIAAPILISLFLLIRYPTWQGER